MKGKGDIEKPDEVIEGCDTVQKLRVQKEHHAPQLYSTRRMII